MGVLRRSSTPCLLVVAVAILAACDQHSSNATHSQVAKGVLVVDRGESYSASRMLACLTAADIQASAGKPSNLLKPLNQLPDVTAVIDIQAGGKIAPGVIEGRAMDSGLLLFESSPSKATANETAAWRAFMNRGPLIYIPIPGSASQPPKTPTAAQQVALQSVFGNVLAFWDFPRQYPAQSKAVIERCLTASRGSGPAPKLTHTQIDSVTPFHFDRRPMPTPRLPTYAGTCTAGSVLLTVNSYTCRSEPEAGEPGCTKGCIYESCWLDASKTPHRSMVCLLSPFVDPQLGASVSTDEVRITVTNHPATAKQATNPLTADPWGFTLPTGNTCEGEAVSGHLANGAPALLYGCGGTIAPAGPIDRSDPIWRVKMSNGKVMRISNARFAANDPQ